MGRRASLIVLSLVLGTVCDANTATLVDDDGWETVTKSVPEVILKDINAKYLEKVRPILKGKCLVCHGINQSLPWYAIIPGAKQLINDDMEEAKEHIDMSNDFPFEGHGRPQDDLEQLGKMIDKGEMPPFRYKLLHWSSSLTENEKRAVQDWINDSLIIMNKAMEEKK